MPPSLPPPANSEKRKLEQWNFQSYTLLYSQFKQSIEIPQLSLFLFVSIVLLCVWLQKVSKKVVKISSSFYRKTKFTGLIAFQRGFKNAFIFWGHLLLRKSGEVNLEREYWPLRLVSIRTPSVKWPGGGGAENGLKMRIWFWDFKQKLNRRKQVEKYENKSPSLGEYHLYKNS